MSERATTAWDRVRRWSTAAAVLATLLGVADLVRWANRWYVTEMFARSGEVEWQFLYERLQAAHQALVSGLALLVAAGAFAVLAGFARRRRTAAAVSVPFHERRRPDA